MDYKIVYSKRKTVSLKITEEGLVVHSPHGVSKAKLDKIVEKHSAWVEKTAAKVEREESFWGKITKEQEKELRALARELLTKKTEFYSNVMGLKYGKITITSAKRRFGSCSSRGDISYSYRLIVYPERAIDYVVVHELCHLVYMNHSKDFYTLLAKILPDYKERRALLKNK